MFCCMGSRRRRGGHERDSVFPEAPNGMRKLTIDHGRVVTAPPSPQRNSYFLASKWTTSMYSKRSTMVSVIPDKELTLGLPPTATATSSVVAGPPSPTLSLAPTIMSVRSNRTRRTSIRRPNLATMREGTGQDAEEELPSRATSSHSSRDARSANEILKAPEPILTTSSNAAAEPIRKASLGAISAAVSAGPMPVKKTSGPSRSKSSKSSKLREVVPADNSSVSSNEDDKSPTSSGSTSRTSPNISPNLRPGKFAPVVPSEVDRRDKPRKHRPPPITTSRSFSKNKAPSALKRETRSTVSSVSPRTKDFPASLKTPVSEVHTVQDNRQSVFSVTSSQYSPTFSIRPVNQVQIVQAKTVGQIRPTAVKQAPTTGTRLAGIAAASPPATNAPPKAFYPPNYALKSPSTQVNASLVGMVAKDLGSPQSDDQGFTTAPTSATSPKSVRLGSPEVPLTSASLSFPPNLPDYSFAAAEDLPTLPLSRKGSDVTTISELSAIPEATPKQAVPRHGIPTEMAASDENRIASPKKGVRTTVTAISTDRGVKPSVKNISLKGMTTIAVSELAGSTTFTKNRQRAARC